MNIFLESPFPFADVTIIFPKKNLYFYYSFLYIHDILNLLGLQVELIGYQYQRNFLE